MTDLPFDLVLPSDTDRLCFLPLSASGIGLVLACLVAAMVALPRARAQNVRIGGRIGPTFGFLSDSAVPFSGNDAAVNANPRLDFHAGAYAVVPTTPSFALQPELLYLQKGGHFSRPTAESYSVERYRLSYLQGALLGRRNISIPGPLSLYAVAGLSLDVALSGRTRRNVRTAELNVERQVDLMKNDRLRRWTVGGIIGAGLRYLVGPTGRLTFSIRYNPGLSPVFANPERPTPSSPQTIEDLFPLPRSPSALRSDVVTTSLSYTLPLRSLL